MKLPLYKLWYMVFAIVSGMTVGIFLSFYVGICAFINTIIQFPIQIYRQLVYRRMQIEIENLLEQNLDSEELADSIKEETIWDKHIRRMEQKNERN